MKPQDYRMPVPYRGQIVLWYEGGVKNEDRAAPAVVLVENHSSLHLRVLGPEGNFDKTCVKHVDDPTAKEYDRIQEGGWNFTTNFRPATRTSELEKASPLAQEPNFAEVE